MGKCFMRCTHDVGHAWQPMIMKMIGEIIDVASEFENDVEIIGLTRDGCELKVEYAVPGTEINTTFIYALEGIITTYCDILRSICPKCGAEKGAPPSTMVNPGLCENCRKNLSSEDFAGCSVIGMIGKAGSGKDTVAEQLVKKHGYKRMSFADPLRDIVQLVFVLDKNTVWDRELREKPLEFLPEWTVRKLLQFVGTELFRDKIWRDIWMYNLLQRMEPGNNYVITDVRFPNEMSGIIEGFGGKTTFVEVVRKGCVGVDVGIPNHESEAYEFCADVVIENNGTLEDLYDEVENLIKDIFVSTN